MQKEHFDELERYISTSRLSTYRNAISKPNAISTIQYYIYNAKLSDNFYFLLQNFEVTLRNAIYYAYSKHFSKPFYFLYETDVRQRYRQKKEFHSRECWKMLCGARYNLIKQLASLNDGKLTAELNFGFWSKLLTTSHLNYTKMWHQIFFDVFPYYPYQHSVDEAIKHLGDIVDKLRRFRNRIFHYEPIFNHTNLHKIHNEIIEVLGWISPELQKLSQAFDEFNTIVHSKKQIEKKLRKLYLLDRKKIENV